jgi:hypothetical protein
VEVYIHAFPAVLLPTRDVEVLGSNFDWGIVTLNNIFRGFSQVPLGECRDGFSIKP